MNLSESFLKCDIYGGLNYFVLGARELSLGNIEEAIVYEDKTRDSLAYLGNTTIVTSVFNLLNFALSGQWAKMQECIEILNSLKVKAYLPSFLVYCQAASLRLMMDEENRPELEELISEKLVCVIFHSYSYSHNDVDWVLQTMSNRHLIINQSVENTNMDCFSTFYSEVKNCRGFFVLKKVFYEKMVAHRANQFCNNVKAWNLPVLEILYVGNFIYCIENKPKYINRFLEAVENKLETLAKNDADYWEIYASALFFKAFLLKLRGDHEDALTYFHEILSLESVIEQEVQVIPQTCYEIGLIHRKNKKKAEAKRWLNKASKYSGKN